MNEVLIEGGFPRSMGQCDSLEFGDRIYAVMVTGKSPARARLAAVSIQAFLAQSYDNSELIIVNDGDFCFRFENVLKGRVKEIRVQRGLTLGELRNVGLGLIPENAIYVQWDDDDWHADDLLSLQKKFLDSQFLFGCALGAQVKYSMDRNSAWEHVLPVGFYGFSGTIMVKNKKDVRYPAWPRDEDSDFWANYMSRYSVSRWDCCAEKYIRFIHGDSTTFFGTSGVDEDVWRLSAGATGCLETILPKYGVSSDKLRKRRVISGAPLTYA